MPARLVVLLNDADWEELHKMMALAIEGSDGKIKFKLFEGGYNQEWYRTVIRRGMRALQNDFDKKMKEIEHES